MSNYLLTLDLPSEELFLSGGPDAGWKRGEATFRAPMKVITGLNLGSLKPAIFDGRSNFKILKARAIPLLAPLVVGSALNIGGSACAATFSFDIQIGGVLKPRIANLTQYSEWQDFDEMIEPKGEKVEFISTGFYCYYDSLLVPPEYTGRQFGIRAELLIKTNSKIIEA